MEPGASLAYCTGETIWCPQSGWCPFPYRRRDGTKYLSVRQNNESPKPFGTRARYIANVLNYASPKAIPGAARSFVSHPLAGWLGGGYWERQAFCLASCTGKLMRGKPDILPSRRSSGAWSLWPTVKVKRRAWDLEMKLRSLEPLWPTAKLKRRGLGPGNGAWSLGPLRFTVQVRRSGDRSPDGALSRIDVEMKRNTFQSAKTTNPPKPFGTRAHYIANLSNYPSPKAIPGATLSSVSHPLACWLGGQYCEQHALCLASCTG